jgi:hypothetical protein
VGRGAEVDWSREGSRDDRVERLLIQLDAAAGGERLLARLVSEMAQEKHEMLRVSE